MRALLILAFSALLFACEAPPEPRCAQANCIALTFDDGPGPYTAVLLDMLRDQGAHATFFVLGQRVERAPELVVRMVNEGHEVGNHSWSHPILPRLSTAQIEAQIFNTNAAIAAAADGYIPVVFRPPYGSFSPRVAAIVPYIPIGWNIDTRDWESHSTYAITRLAQRARPGSIILMHDINSASIRAIPAILAELRARGFVFATVSELAYQNR